jgi:hypothetical protein
MKRGVIYLLFALPLASVIMGAITLYIAFSDADQPIKQSQSALGKTSWRDPVSRTDKASEVAPPEPVVAPE